MAPSGCSSRVIGFGWPIRVRASPRRTCRSSSTASIAANCAADPGNWAWSVDRRADDHPARRLGHGRSLGSGRCGVHHPAAGRDQPRGAHQAVGTTSWGPVPLVQRRPRHLLPYPQRRPPGHVPAHPLLKVVARGKPEPGRIQPCRIVTSFREEMSAGSRRRGPAGQHDAARAGSRPRDRPG